MTYLVLLSRLKRDSNPDLCNAIEGIYQLSHKANWKVVIMLVADKLIDDGYLFLNEIHVYLNALD